MFPHLQVDCCLVNSPVPGVGPGADQRGLQRDQPRCTSGDGPAPYPGDGSVNLLQSNLHELFMIISMSNILHYDRIESLFAFNQLKCSICIKYS